MSYETSVIMSDNDLEPLYEGWRALANKSGGWTAYADTLGELYDTLRDALIFEHGEYAVAHVPAR